MMRTMRLAPPAHAPLVYLVHLDTPIAGRASHYLGWTVDLDARMHQHRTGRGSCLLAAAVARGVGFRVVRTWPGNWTVERRLKRRHDTPGLCPLCSTQRQARKAASRLARRLTRQQPELGRGL